MNAKEFAADREAGWLKMLRTALSQRNSADFRVRSGARDTARRAIRQVRSYRRMQAA